MTWTLVAQIGVLALVGCFVAVVGEAVVSSYLDKANTRTMKWSDRQNIPERPDLRGMFQPPYPSTESQIVLGAEERTDEDPEGRDGPWTP